MPVEESNLAERSGNLVEAKDGYDPRLLAFYPIVAVLLLLLAGGLAYQQLNRWGLHHESEWRQDNRRLVFPGPRGNIYDREHRLLVGNRPRLAVVLYLDELRLEYQKTRRSIVNAYRDNAPKTATGKRSPDELPTDEQYTEIAWNAVVQKYLDQADVILKRTDKVDNKTLDDHLRQILLPYTLIDDLKPEEYAKLLEELPVTSPLHLYTTNTRYYPYKSAAAHVLGYVGTNDKLINEDFPGDDLRTFQMKSTVGRDGLEEKFDGQLQGDPGYAIVRIDNQGYQVSLRESSRPKQGKNLVTSIDIDLQQAAEEAIGDYSGAAVAMDVATGEVLVLASKPDYDLNDFSPRISKATYQKILEEDGLFNRATQGCYPPGSTFKIISSIAGMRDAGMSPTTWTADCDGSIMIGNRAYKCDNGEGHHGALTLPGAITTSCDVFFYEWAMQAGPEALASEARRFHLDQPTGIELPNETRRMTVPDPAYKLKHHPEEGPWRKSDTAVMGIGQSFLLESPMVMCCFAASLARGETTTVPTLLHDPERPRQHSDSIGLTGEQAAAIREGMIGATHDGPLKGTASLLTTTPALQLPCEIAGKTGTAQVSVRDKQTKEIRRTDVAWFICYAPVDKPEIAVAVAIEGDTTGGETFSGALHSGPVADAILKTYFDKKAHPHQMLKTQLTSNQ